MTVSIDGYFSTVNNTSTVFWNGVAGDQIGQWLVIVHAVAGGSITDMGTGDPGKDLNWPAGAWHLLTQVDAGDGLPKMRVWATRFTDTVSRSLVLPTGSGVNNHSHLYFLSGLRDFDAPERVFSVGAVTSATGGTSQAAPLYAPDDSGLLIGAWISGTAAVNYTSLDTLTARTEVDGSASTSRAGEETVTAHGPGTVTATASAAEPWAAVSIVARDAAGSVTFPVSPLRSRTELALGANPDADPATWAGLWTDITVDVQPRSPITITRGRGDEASTSQPSTMTLTLDNTAGKYVRLNPTGPYYGLLNKNTPIRQWVDYGAGMDVRYTGQVSEWPPRSQGGQVDENMPIAAAGLTRRLTQGQALHSPLFRRIVADAATAGYWSLETDTSSGLVGGTAMRVTGQVSFSSGDGPPGSAGAMSTGNDGKTFGVVPRMLNTGAWSVSWWINVPADLDADLESSMLVGWQTPSGDPAKHNTWGARIAPGNGGAIGVGIQDDAGNATEVLSPIDLRGLGWVLVTVMASISGGTDTFAMLQLGLPGVAIEGTVLSGEHPSPIAAIYVNGPVGPTVTIKGSICHLMARAEPQQTGSSLKDALLDAGAGYAGERAADRIRRLSGETGIPAVVIGDDGTSEPMGPQPTGTILDVWRDVETTDGGVLYEQRDGRIAYQPRNARYNTDPVLTLDYTSRHVAPPLEPTDDDKSSRNDWTISRSGGGSARVTDPDSIAQIGLYNDSATLNVADDDQLLDQAGWRVHLGTNDDLRYPAITPNLLGTPELIPDWVSADIGDAAAITNPGRDLPPGDIDLVIEGYTETIDVTEWHATPNCSPGGVWHVGVLDDAVLGRLDTDGSELAAAAGATDATLSVAVTAGPLWTTDETDMPFGITVGGEQVTVTAVGQTLNTNPYVESDITGWNAFNTTLARSTAQVHPNGVASILVTPNGTSATGGVNSDSTAVSSIVAGQSYTAVLWVYSPAGWADIRPGIDWQDATGALISNAFGAQTAVPAGVWTRLSVTLTAPAGVSRAAVRGRHAGTPAATDVWYAWGIRLIPGTSPQQMTVTRSINGVVKTHGSGEDVRLTQPLILSL